MGLVCITFLYPFIYTFSLSISDARYIFEGSIYLWPKGVNIEAYRAIFSDKSLVNSFFFTLLLTVTGVVGSILMTTLAAYPLSKTRLKGSGLIMRLIVFTMYFSGGLIPNYILVKSMGLLNTMGALIFPEIIHTFLLIIMINFLRGIPVELEEAARVEGASVIGILMRIIIPLSKPVIATLTVYYAVSYWNMFFQALIYITSPALYTLQIKLYQVLNVFMDDIKNTLDAEAAKAVINENMKAAMVIVVTFPILFVYPFLQRYFIKGMTLGALKG